MHRDRHAHAPSHNKTVFSYVPIHVYNHTEKPLERHGPKMASISGKYGIRGRNAVLEIYISNV